MVHHPGEGSEQRGNSPAHWTKCQVPEQLRGQLGPSFDSLSDNCLLPHPGIQEAPVKLYKTAVQTPLLQEIHETRADMWVGGLHLARERQEDPDLPCARNGVGEGQGRDPTFTEHLLSAGHPPYFPESSILPVRKALAPFCQ